MLERLIRVAAQETINFLRPKLKSIIPLAAVCQERTLWTERKFNFRRKSI